MSARVLAGTVSLMTRGQLRILHSVRAGGFRTATGSVLSDGSALIDAKRGPLVEVDANGCVPNAGKIDTDVWVACGRPSLITGRPVVPTPTSAHLVRASS